MEYTTLGRTGTRVSKICFGTWRFGETSGTVVETDRDEAHELLDTAANQGINFIDTANRYGDPPGTSEKYVGEWLADRDRDEFVIATKVGLPVGDSINDSGISRRHIRRQVEKSLDRLGTDYIDLYYIHRLDDVSPVEETLSTLSELVAEGKVNYLGASTMAAWQLATLDLTAEAHDWTGFTVTQPPVDATLNNWKRYDPFNLDRYLEVCADRGLGVCPYSPLAGGFLTGKYDQVGGDPTAIDGPDGSRGELLPEAFDRKYLSESAWSVLEEISAIADELDATPAQVALRWVIQQELPNAGTMVPIVGARTPDQLRENAGAGDIELHEDHLDRIDAARGEAFSIDSWPVA
jgi:aryl-alcohol dehydrogenase-like predicted oxidoreductase